jgi:hypothetical protein
VLGGPDAALATPRTLRAARGHAALVQRRRSGRVTRDGASMFILNIFSVVSAADFGSVG